MTLSASLRETVEAALHSARMKGIAVALSRSDENPQLLCAGTDAADWPITRESIFPVASVTKLATALAVLRLVDAGALAIDDPLARYVPEAVAAGHWGVTVRRLLSHTSGLPLDVPEESAPYGPGLSWQTLTEVCVQTPLEQPQSTRVQYSNVGYGLLGVIVERVTEQSFAGALAQLVLKPLGIEAYLGEDLPRSPVVLSGVRSAHANTELEPFNSRFWRSLAMPWGGLLTTPTGALALVRAFARHPEGFLSTPLLAEAVRNQNGALGGGFVSPLVWEHCPWGLGPELRNQKRPHWAPPSASHTSFGHSGASGCIAWYDPPTSTAWAIMGTRTADSGWLLRRGPEIGAEILESADPQGPDRMNKIGKDGQDEAD